jgi:hypothetical protein
VVVAVVLALLPMVAAWIVDHGHGYSPLGDEALIDLHVRDLLAGHLPALGPWSRYGWNHPGPALYYLLSPFTLLSGKAGWGTMAGGAALQALAVVGIAWIAWRRGGWKLSLAAMVAVSVMYSTKAVAVVLDPWNPYVVFPFVALLAFAVWASVAGDPVQIVTAVAAGSFLVQSHIGYAPFVAVAVLFVVVVLVIDHRRDRLPRARWGRIGAGAAVVGGLMWLPPIVQQFTGAHGNLTAIADYFTSGAAHGMGVRDGLGYFAANFAVPPPWLFPQHQDAVFLHQESVAWLLVPVALLAAGAWAAHKTGSRADARLVAVAALFAITGAFAYSGIEPPAWQYLAMWRIPITVLVWFASLWALARWASRSISWRSTRRASAVLVTASLVVIAWGAGGYALRVLDHGKPIVNWDRSPVLLADRILHDRSPGSVLVWQVGGALSGLDVGLVDELARRGVDAHLDDRGVTAEIDRRVASPKDVDQVWYMVTEPWVDRYSSRAGAEVLARLTPLSPARDRELADLQRWLLDQLDQHGRSNLEWLAESDVTTPKLVGIPGIDEQRVRRLAELNHEVIHSDRCRCAVVAVPASTANP